MITQRLDDRDQFAADMERLDDEAVNEYSHLVGLTYPDREGRTITVLDVDEWGTALMERGGEYWGCKAEYLEGIQAEQEAAPDYSHLDQSGGSAMVGQPAYRHRYEWRATP